MDWGEIEITHRTIHTLDTLHSTHTVQYTHCTEIFTVFKLLFDCVKKWFKPVHATESTRMAIKIAEKSVKIPEICWKILKKNR